MLTLKVFRCFLTDLASFTGHRRRVQQFWRGIAGWRGGAWFLQHLHQQDRGGEVKR